MGRFSNIITSNKWDEKQNNIGEQSMQELPEDQIEHEMEAIDPSNKTTPYSIDEKQYNTKKEAWVIARWRNR